MLINYNLIENKVHLISPSGDLDSASSLEMEILVDKLINDSYQKIFLINCEKVDFINSTGIGFFAALVKKKDMNQISVCVCNLSEKNKRIFWVTGLDSVMKVFSNQQMALQELLS